MVNGDVYSTHELFWVTAHIETHRYMLHEEILAEFFIFSVYEHGIVTNNFLLKQRISFIVL